MTYYSAIQNPIYRPAVRDILSITQANPAVVTTTFDGSTPGAHGYLTGIIARIDIPIQFGMQQLNGFQSVLTVLSPSTFSIAINTTGFDAFVNPSPDPRYTTPAQVVPIGEVAAILTQSFVNVLTPQFQES